MFWREGARRILVTLGLVMAMVPGIVGLAQDEEPEQGQVSPARRHAEVIAHGVAAMPSDEIAWRLEVKQALAADRSVAETRAAGFLLAGDGDVVVTDAAGEVVARLAPGEALWTETGEQRAVVSAAGGRVDYLDIALVPADRAAGGDSAAITASFSAPDGEAFDVDLIRDVLERGEESVIPDAPTPMLLVVTAGKVFVDSASGEIDEISAGAFAQVEGDIVITGASRAPASFVVARIGPSSADRVTLQPANATPSAFPAATPISASSEFAAVHIAVFVCPVAYDGRDFGEDCAEPAAGVAFSIEAGGETVSSRLSDQDGELSFADITAGDYTLLAGAPGGIASSEMQCRDRSEDEVGVASGANQTRLTLRSGENIDCDWYIVPADERFGQSSLSVAIRACPEGTSPARFDPEACTSAPPGSTLTLRDGQTGKPLGVAAARADNWKWNGLGPFSYDLDVNALPAGFVDSALDDQPCCRAEHDFTVLVPRQARKVVRTLFLFPPDVPRDNSLTVLIRACPPGMTADTLVEELCDPAPPGTTLSLREHGIAIGVAAAANDAWLWDGLGALPYELIVNATPPGFTGYQLDEGCCAGEGRFSLTLPAESSAAERTLFLFQPPIAGEDIDSDEDGLYNAQETKFGTQPFMADTDGDALGDGDEVDFYGTDPLRSDTDDDGLNDTVEVQTHGTNPFLADTDGDGAPDAKEIDAASDPLDMLSTPATPTAIPTATPLPTAKPAATETPLPVGTPFPTATLQRPVAAPRPGLAPSDDLDGDGLATLDEIVIHGTNPIVDDSDGDGVDDGREVAAGSDPRDPQSR